MHIVVDNSNWQCQEPPTKANNFIAVQPERERHIREEGRYKERERGREADKESGKAKGNLFKSERQREQQLQLRTRARECV